GVALAGLPIALWAGVLTVPFVAAVAFVQGVSFTGYGLAERASLPRLVRPDLLPAALAPNHAKTRGAAPAEPPPGGALVGGGRRPAVPSQRGGLHRRHGRGDGRADRSALHGRHAHRVALGRGDQRPAVDLAKPARAGHVPVGRREQLPVPGDGSDHRRPG